MLIVIQQSMGKMSTGKSSHLSIFTSLKHFMIMIIILVLYGAHIHAAKDAQGACVIPTPALAPAT